MHSYALLTHLSQDIKTLHTTSLSLSLAHQLLCSSSSLCHNNMPYFPTPIHLAVADPDDNGMLILQNASKYSLNDRVPPPNNLFFNTTVRISTAAQSSMFSTLERYHHLLMSWGKTHTGRFIMFSVITNIYNKKTKGPTLMELFTAIGKLKKFFFYN